MNDASFQDFGIVTNDNTLEWFQIIIWTFFIFILCFFGHKAYKKVSRNTQTWQLLCFFWVIIATLKDKKTFQEDPQNHSRNTQIFFLKFSFTKMFFFNYSCFRNGPLQFWIWLWFTNSQFPGSIRLIFWEIPQIRLNDTDKIYNNSYIPTT